MKSYASHKQKTAGLSILVIILQLILLSGCEKSEPLQPEETSAADNAFRSSPEVLPPFTMLVIEHNCMSSSLPDYNVYLNSDGKVIYHGWKNVAHAGVVEFKTDAETVSYIRNLFESAHFFNIPPIPAQYDDPFVATTYRNRYATRTLIDYDQGKPQVLIQIRIKAEEKLNISRFVNDKLSAKQVNVL